MGNNLTIDELQSAVFSISDKIKEIERKTGFDKYGDILAAPQIAEKLFTPDGGDWKKFIEETARARERQPEAYEAGATKRQPKGSNTAGTSERDKIRDERGRE